MGFFSKKKGFRDSSSAPLSEAEVHRKLYGEFGATSPRTVTGEREYLKEPVPAPLPEKETSVAPDLFSVSADFPRETETPAVHNRPVIKSPENASRYVPLHEFEKKKVSGIDASESQGRFRSDQKSKIDFVGIGSRIVAATRSIFEAIADPKRVMLRRVLSVSVAAAVVFLLFWGVNVLNSQREESMKMQYKSRKEPPPAVETVPAAAHETVSQAEERPVVITPAPVRPRAPERDVVITPAAPIKKKEPAAPSYAIQVVTYPSQTDAEQVVEALKKEQLNAFTKENVRPSGRVFYVVLIGGYPTEEEAQAHLTKFRAKEVARPFQDAFVKAI